MAEEEHTDKLLLKAFYHYKRVLWYSKILPWHHTPCPCTHHVLLPWCIFKINMEHIHKIMVRLCNQYYALKTVEAAL